MPSSRPKPVRPTRRHKRQNSLLYFGKTKKGRDYFREITHTGETKGIIFLLSGPDSSSSDEYDENAGLYSKYENISPTDKNDNDEVQVSPEIEEITQLLSNVNAE